MFRVEMPEGDSESDDEAVQAEINAAQKRKKEIETIQAAAKAKAKADSDKKHKNRKKTEAFDAGGFEVLGHCSVLLAFDPACVK